MSCSFSASSYLSVTGSSFFHVRLVDTTPAVDQELVCLTLSSAGKLSENSFSFPNTLTSMLKFTLGLFAANVQ